AATDWAMACPWTSDRTTATATTKVRFRKCILASMFVPSIYAIGRDGEGFAPRFARRGFAPRLTLTLCNVPLVPSAAMRWRYACSYLAVRYTCTFGMITSEHRTSGGFMRTRMPLAIIPLLAIWT